MLKELINLRYDEIKINLTYNRWELVYCDYNVLLEDVKTLSNLELQLDYDEYTIYVDFKSWLVIVNFIKSIDFTNYL